MSACFCMLYELMWTFSPAGVSSGSGWVQGLVPQDSTGSGGITLMLFLSSGFSPSSGKPHLAAK